MNPLILQIPKDAEGIFVKRENRFLGIVDIVSPYKEKNVFVHIHDSGRLKDLLYPGNKVFLTKKDDPHRKTKWDIVSTVYKGEEVLTNSGYHNKIAKILFKKSLIDNIKNLKTIKPEPRIGKDRLDFLIQTKKEEIWVEVKGCTLEKNGIALFPDAPTKRGQKHLKNLTNLKKTGKRGILLFLVLRPNSRCFSINKDLDPEFYALFLESIKFGVETYPILLFLKNEHLYFKGVLDICIDE